RSAAARRVACDEHWRRARRRYDRHRSRVTVPSRPRPRCFNGATKLRDPSGHSLERDARGASRYAPPVLRRLPSTMCVPLHRRPSARAPLHRQGPFVTFVALVAACAAATTGCAARKPGATLASPAPIMMLKANPASDFRLAELEPRTGTGTGTTG